MSRFLKWIAAALPRVVQQELKRLHYRRQIRRRTFGSDEPEYEILGRWVNQGDWTIDLGANVGHYTARLSQLVGPRGRVIAFEPILETFSLLVDLAVASQLQNVTFVNAAASATTTTLGMRVPTFETGLKNYYQARISTGGETRFAVLGLAIDNLAIEHRVSFVKIDVEGHESQALVGMRKLLERDHPVLLIEGKDASVTEYVSDLGYHELPTVNGSPNTIYLYEPVDVT